jgi:hypothetical protein
MYPTKLKDNTICGRWDDELNANTYVWRYIFPAENPSKESGYLKPFDK